MHTGRATATGVDLAGERVLLRELTPSDWRAIYAFMGLPGIDRYRPGAWWHRVPADTQGETWTDLAAALRDREAVFGDPAEAHAKRQAIERRIEATKGLRGAVADGRRRASGTQERLLARMRQGAVRW